MFTNTHTSFVSDVYSNDILAKCKIHFLPHHRYTTKVSDLQVFY